MSVTCHHLILLRQDLPLIPDLGWHPASPSNSLTSALRIAKVTATYNYAPDFYGVLGIRTQIFFWLVQQLFLSTEPSRQALWYLFIVVSLFVLGLKPRAPYMLSHL